MVFLLLILSTVALFIVDATLLDLPTWLVWLPAFLAGVQLLVGVVYGVMIAFIGWRISRA